MCIVAWAEWNPVGWDGQGALCWEVESSCLGPKLYLDGAHCLTGIWRSMNFIRLSHKTGALMVVYSTCGPGRLFFKHLCTFVFSSAEWGVIDPTP